MILLKTLDPIKIFRMSATCFPLKYFEPIWSENEKRHLKAITEFFEDTSGNDKGNITIYVITRVKDAYNVLNFS